MDELKHKALIREGLSNEEIIAAYIIDYDDGVIEAINEYSLHINESIRPVDGFKSTKLLNLAIETQNYIAFSALIRKGAHLGARGDDEGNTPLICAIELGTPSMRSELIKQMIGDYNPHIANHSHETPLHVAVMYKDIKTARKLIESNAPTQMLNDEKQTPLDIALDIIEELTKKGE